MCICVTESRDSQRLLAAMDRLDASADRARELFKEDTRKAFEGAFKGEMTAVEYVGFYPLTRIKVQPTRDAFMEELENVIPNSALWEMLKDSQCPLVAKLKEAVIASYTENWVDEIGEFRSEA